MITLDVEMPRMDGLTFLKKIMSQHPIPVVICSSLAGKKTETAFKALEYGAVEIIHKPALGTKQMLHRIEHADLRCRGGCIADQDQEDIGHGRNIPGTAQAQRRRDHCQGQTRCRPADHRKGGCRRGVHGRDRGIEDLSGGPAKGLPGHRHRAAHARRVYRSLFQAP